MKKLTLAQINKALKEVETFEKHNKLVGYISGVPLYENKDVPDGVLWCKKYKGLFKPFDISKYIKGSKKK